MLLLKDKISENGLDELVEIFTSEIIFLLLHGMIESELGELGGFIVLVIMFLFKDNSGDNRLHRIVGLNCYSKFLENLLLFFYYSN